MEDNIECPRRTVGTTRAKGLAQPETLGMSRNPLLVRRWGAGDLGAHPEWIFPFTRLQPAQIRRLVRLVAERDRDAIADGRPGRQWSLGLADRLLLVAAYWRANPTIRQTDPLNGCRTPLPTGSSTPSPARPRVGTPTPPQPDRHRRRHPTRPATTSIAACHTECCTPAGRHLPGPERSATKTPTPCRPSRTPASISTSTALLTVPRDVW